MLTNRADDGAAPGEDVAADELDRAPVLGLLREQFKLLVETSSHLLCQTAAAIISTEKEK